MSASIIRTLLNKINSSKSTVVEKEKFRLELRSVLDKMNGLDTCQESFDLIKNDSELSELAEALVGNISIKKLSLNKPFDFKGSAGTLGDFFETIAAEDCSITALDLSGWPIDEESAKKLANFISQNTQLQQLTISGGSITPIPTMDPKVFSILAKALHESKTITHLNFKYPLGNESINDLADIIKTSAITRLVLDKTQPTTPENRELLKQAINESRTLQQLTWFGAISEPWYRSWEDAIDNQLRKNDQSNASLREIETQEKEASQIDASMSEKQKFSKLIDFLKRMDHNPTDSQKATLKKMLNHFTKLDLGIEKLTDYNIVNLSQALKTNETVVHLRKGGWTGKMGLTAIVALSNMILKNKTIHFLDLSQALTKESINCLITILAKDKTLLHLDLSDNPLGAEAEAGYKFANALAKNNTLKTLDLRSTGLAINTNMLTELRNALLNNTSLEALLLGNGDGRYSNKIDYISIEGLKIIESLLETNKTLVTFDYPTSMNDDMPERAAILNSIKERLKSNLDRREETVKEALSHLPVSIAGIVREYLGPYDPLEVLNDLTSTAEKKIAAIHQAEKALKKAKSAADKATIAAKSAAISANKATRAHKITERIELENEKEREKANKAAAQAAETAQAVQTVSDSPQIAQDKPTTISAPAIITKEEATEEAKRIKSANDNAEQAAVVPVETSTLQVDIQPAVPTPVVVVEAPQPSQVQQSEKRPEEPKGEPLQSSVAFAQVASQPPQKKNLQTAAGICLAIAIIVTPLLFIFAMPLAGGLVLAALLAISAVTFGLSRQGGKGENSSETQPARAQPPQEAPTLAGSIRQQDIQSGVELSQSSPEPDKGSKKGRKSSR